MSSIPHTQPANEAAVQHASNNATRLPLKVRIANLLAVILPFAGFVLAVVLLWGVAFNWIYLALFFGMYLITAVGITVGYHRYFAHKSFTAPAWVEATLAIFGSMAVEGSVLRWVAVHRRHHQHSDHEEDPHSPHTFGAGVLNIIRGFWHAHMGWLFAPATSDLDRYVKDLKAQPLVRWMSRLFPLWILLGLAIPTALGGLITLSWTGALLGLLWGGFARIFFVHHVTWSINSVCHIWGNRPFNSHDESRNNPIFGVLAMGEGWHNNHHAFPTSARHGLTWWQLDASYAIIRLMGLLGLARDIRVPSAEAHRRQTSPIAESIDTQIGESSAMSQTHFTCRGDRLLDTADAIIDVLVATPGMSVNKLTNRDEGTFQHRVFQHLSNQEIHEATRFLTRCGIIAFEPTQVPSSSN